MKNSNMIISVIIVLCIAAGVTVYSITNPKGGISNLLGYTPSDDGDAGDGSTGSDGVNNGTSSNGSGNSGSNSGSNGGSSSNSRGGNSNGNSGTGGMSASKAENIAQNAIGVEGAYAGTPYWDRSSKMWIVKIYDKNGNVIDGIGVEANGHTNRV
ncbi:hypothetical protein ALNOE001_00700 [Candidatus Methanobinarius endosymbioticus]|uniref:PepSY domain-containing protein n=1 Tax=Candidatus Methanobinarius endosymbioticus TaxID=2006182 RepID=A0A366ME82_9EURY|nr:hypothetical protein ALNOE001_00700 [Candidatus Methanobinarius endosymbioticus]